MKPNHEDKWSACPYPDLWDAGGRWQPKYNKRSHKSKEMSVTKIGHLFAFFFCSKFLVCGKGQ